MHFDEVCRVAAGLKFENAQIVASAAELLLILHLAPPLVPRFPKTLAANYAPWEI
jgi:hypothetical protein